MSASTTSENQVDSNGEDPYIYLEEVESEESIAFAKMANEQCLAQLGDPSHTDTYRRVLAALESDDRIPNVNLLGYDPTSGDMLLYNFWKDSKVSTHTSIVWALIKFKYLSSLNDRTSTHVIPGLLRIQKDFGEKQP